MSTQKKALQKAIKLAGGQSALARKLSKPKKPIKQQHVWNWLERDGVIPSEQAIPIEAAVNGAVTRHQLRPDIYPLENR